MGSTISRYESFLNKDISQSDVIQNIQGRVFCRGKLLPKRSVTKEVDINDDVVVALFLD